MKKLEIGGKIFYYKLKRYDCGEYGASDCYETYFFKEGNQTRTIKKYFLWGPNITIDNYFDNADFMIDFNIESKFKTREEVKKAIDKKIALLNREEEIKNGKII